MICKVLVGKYNLGTCTGLSLCSHPLPLIYVGRICHLVQGLLALYTIFVALDIFTVRVELSSAFNNLKLRDGRKGEGKGF